MHTFDELKSGHWGIFHEIRPGDMFISTTAVFLAELVKLVTCLGLVWNSEDRDVGRYENHSIVSDRVFH